MPFLSRFDVLRANRVVKLFFRAFCLPPEMNFSFNYLANVLASLIEAVVLHPG